ncbi:hypothetical protein HYW17_01285 [Candidatus Uhrbacteria bacterium]|nr:hypothetical protein [Candidatus Uhrbacteria bacterium]
MFKRFQEAYREARQEGRERGKNVNVKFVFRRHEQPGIDEKAGTPMDFLTEAGVELAKKTGRELPQDAYLMVAGSRGVKRARESGGHMLGSFRDEAGAAAIVNREMSGEQQEKMGHGKIPPGDVVIYRSGDLDPEKGFSIIRGAARQEGVAKELPAVVDWWLANQNKTRDLGAPALEDIAAEMAHRLTVGVNMSGKLYEGLDVRFENLTHGPKLVAFLKEVLLKKDGTRGFEKLEEIGGMVKPGEAVEIDIKRDEKGRMDMKLKFRGKEYDIDQKRLLELVDLYRQQHPVQNVE